MRPRLFLHTHGPQHDHHVNLPRLSPRLRLPRRPPPPYSLPPHSTSPPAASTPTACACLPPFTLHTDATCTLLPTLPPSLSLAYPTLAGLAPASSTPIPGHGCASPPHGLGGPCAQRLDLHVHSPTHLTLLAHNLLIEPAYLGLLFAVLDGAKITSTTWTSTQTTFTPQDMAHAGAKQCQRVVQTDAVFFSDPAAQHFTAVETAWDALLRTADAVASARHLRSKYLFVEIFTAANTSHLASRSRECGVEVGDGITAIAGPGVRADGMACPTDAELACLVAPFSVQGLRCATQLLVVVAGDDANLDGFTCTTGATSTVWNQSSDWESALHFLHTLPPVQDAATVYGPHVVGRIEVAVAKHVHDSDENAWGAQNHSLWVEGHDQSGAQIFLERWFAALSLPAPVWLGDPDAGVEVRAKNTGVLEVVLRGALLPRRSILDVVQGLASFAGEALQQNIAWVPDGMPVLDDEVTVPALITADGAVYFSHGSNDTRCRGISSNGTLLFNCTSFAQNLVVQTPDNQTWRPLGHLESATTTLDGELHVLGNVSQVHSALVRLGFTEPILADVTSTATISDGHPVSCGDTSTFAVETTVTAEIEPRFLTHLVRQVLLRLLIDPSYAPSSTTRVYHAGNTTLVVSTPVAGLAACARSSVQNPSFTDADLASALRAVAPLPPDGFVLVTGACVQTCTQAHNLTAWLHRPPGATASAHVNASLPLHPDAVIAALRAFPDVVFPHLTSRQTFVVQTLHNASVLADAAQSVQFGAAPPLPTHPLLAAAHGLESDAGRRRTTVSAQPGTDCVRLEARDAALHVDGVLRRIRAQHAAVAPVTVDRHVVAARLVGPPGALSAKEVLGNAGVAAQVVQASVALRRQRAVVSWSDARFAPPRAVVEGMLQQRGVQTGVDAVRVEGEVWLRVGGMSVTLGQLEFLTSDIELALDDALGFPGNEVLGFGELAGQEGYEFRMRVRVPLGHGAGGECRDVPGQLQAGVEAWAGVLGVAAYIAQASCEISGYAVGVDAGEVQGVWEAVGARGLLAASQGGNVSTAEVEVLGDRADVVEVQARDVEGLVVAARDVLGEVPAAFALAASTMEDKLDVCGIVEVAAVLSDLVEHLGTWFVRGVCCVWGGHGKELAA